MYMAIVIRTTALPAEGIAPAIFAGIDWVMGVFRTVLNVNSDVFCALLVARLEGKTNYKRAQCLGLCPTDPRAGAGGVRPLPAGSTCASDANVFCGTSEGTHVLRRAAQERLDVGELYLCPSLHGLLGEEPDVWG